MKKILAMLLALAMVLSLCACGAKEEPAPETSAQPETSATPEDAATEPEYTYQTITLKWGTVSSEGTVVVDAMNEFAEAIKEATNGNVTIDVYPGSVLGSVSDMIEQCQLGTLAMANTQPSTLAGLGASELYVLSMPYLFSSFDQRWEVLYGDIGKELSDVVTEKDSGLVGFSYFGDGARNFFTNFEVNSIEDLKGHKLRVQNTELDNDWCTALGAIPTPTSTSEMYQALATGLVDGAEQPIANYVSGKYTEVSDYLILDGHTYNTIAIVFSADIWNSLDVQLQDLLTETWDEIIQSKKSVILDNETKLLDDIKSMGITVIEPADLADWASYMDGVYAKYADEYGIGDYITRIQAVQG